MKIYLAGSLANDKIKALGTMLRESIDSIHVFDAWAAAHPEADECWRKYSKESRDQTFGRAIRDHAGSQVFNFDRLNLLAADVLVLVLPCGKSGHLEAGYIAGLREAGFGKKVLAYVGDDPDRYDVMYAFFDQIITNEEHLRRELIILRNKYEEHGRV